jgi:hypothetical protein
MLEFGFTNPILADASGIVAGHGRVMAASKLYREGKRLKLPDGELLPEGCVLVLDCTGWKEDQRRAYILADNQMAMNAGWDNTMLGFELAELKLSGWNPADLGFTRSQIPGAGGSQYTAKIESPVYTAKGERPGIGELADTTKADELCKAIESADLPAEVERFLLMAARRHVRFDYHQIAEYYCHAPAQVQRLMEASALVIIDFKQAIEAGYVQLSNRLSALSAEAREPDED